MKANETKSRIHCKTSCSPRRTKMQLRLKGDKEGGGGGWDDEADADADDEEKKKKRMKKKCQEEARPPDEVDKQTKKQK